MMFQVTSNYDDTWVCDGICIIIEVDFNDFAQRVSHVGIKFLSCQDHYILGSRSIHQVW
jgi:hypothetical protein